MIHPIIYKIYKLIYQGNTIYIGITKNSLNRRKSCGYKDPYLQSIINDCEMVLIEETVDSSREMFWISTYRSEGHNLLNKYRGQYNLNREEKYNLYSDSRKKYYLENQKEILEEKKIYRLENLDKIKEYNLVYRENHKEEKKIYDSKRDRKEYLKEYYQKTKNNKISNG